MLALGNEFRKRLCAIRALSTDSEGNEVFTGLTVAESVFYLEQSQRPQDDLTQVDSQLCLQIKEKHIRARLKILNQEVIAYIFMKSKQQRS